MEWTIGPTDARGKTGEGGRAREDGPTDGDGRGLTDGLDWDVRTYGRAGWTGTDVRTDGRVRTEAWTGTDGRRHGDGRGGTKGGTGADGGVDGDGRRRGRGRDGGREGRGRTEGRTGIFRQNSFQF